MQFPNYSTKPLVKREYSQALKIYTAIYGKQRKLGQKNCSRLESYERIYNEFHVNPK